MFAEEVNVPVKMYEYSEEFKDLVFWMMAYDHKHRPTLEQIRNHPWMLKGRRRRNTRKAGDE